MFFLLAQALCTLAAFFLLILKGKVSKRTICLWGGAAFKQCKHAKKKKKKDSPPKMYYFGHLQNKYPMWSACPEPLVAGTQTPLGEMRVGERRGGQSEIQMVFSCVLCVHKPPYAVCERDVRGLLVLSWWLQEVQNSPQRMKEGPSSSKHVWG